MSFIYIRTLDKPFLWHFARHAAVFFGLLATVNNLLVIHAGYSIFQQVI